MAWDALRSWNHRSSFVGEETSLSGMRWRSRTAREVQVTMTTSGWTRPLEFGLELFPPDFSAFLFNLGVVGRAVSQVVSCEFGRVGRLRWRDLQRTPILRLSSPRDV